MKKEYREYFGSTLVSYEAGRAYDACGYPARFWSCRVVYRYNEIDKVYWVYDVQTSGSGLIVYQSSRETKMTSLQEVTDLLNHFEALERHYQKVYGD